MVGFRNIALHNYQTLQLPITVAIIEMHLDDFLAFTRAVILRDAARCREALTARPISTNPVWLYAVLSGAWHSRPQDTGVDASGSSITNSAPP